MTKNIKCIFGLSGALMIVVMMALTSQAKAVTTDISGAVNQSYSADSSVQIGMIVELKPKDNSTVIPLTIKDINNMLGVVVPVSDSAIVLTPQTSTTQQVLVANSGRYTVLVSNQNGAIHSGDYLTISALDGVAMKASADQAQTVVVGKATTNFDGKTNVIGTTSVKNSSGGNTTVAFGRVDVEVHIVPNPLLENNTNLPGVFARTANGFANKPVSSARLYLSAAVLLATLFLTSTLFYSGIRSGIVAIGRNPLAKKAIGRSLFQTVAAGLMIFIGGLFAVYLILKL